MIRHLAAQFTLLLIAATALTFQAWALEAGQVIEHGFSEDGRYFAFEQRGIQDGTGAALKDQTGGWSACRF